uniref:Uncharacterized protein n=1 Tax=Neovison vison TaxID=452646 RepID=A0A8C7B4P3_NEOVI
VEEVDFFIRSLQKKSILLSTILNKKVLSLSCSYHEHTFSCLMLSYSNFLTQHSMLSPLNPATCHCPLSYIWGAWVAQWFRPLPLARVVISGSWDRAPHRALYSAGSLLLPPPPASPPTCDLSLTCIFVIHIFNFLPVLISSCFVSVLS